MASSTPIQISETSQSSSSKTGLVTSVGSSRSYGTVKQSPNLSFQAPGTPRHCMHHTVEEGDTLQGLALKYNITVSAPLSIVLVAACSFCKPLSSY